ncbi:hypothetical protein UK15_32945 [Streptomyces variegatus]|jgi:hypothetical protein|uniref:SH3b domain-containing protein n=1 Tax=Streptomyces variegatus TaxID=284040 RepID=A0A0M2GDV4_9ACTN|nr:MULTISPECIES: hypothetical protein [Streptomyces]KJK35125.1 hypothetical protein UK15_32945 [Streptomyces variegatus]
MRKRSATLLATAALIGAALPLMGAGPASAGAFKCQPTSHDYVVVKEKTAVHSSFSANAKVVDYVYKNNKVHAYWDCTNSSGNPWVCIGSCRVDEDSITGRWVYRGYLKG